MVQKALDIGVTPLELYLNWISETARPHSIFGILDRDQVKEIPPLEEEGEWQEHSGKLLREAVRPLPMGIRSHRLTDGVPSRQEEVRVAGQRLRAAAHGDVRAEREALLTQRRGQGVVHRHQRAEHPPVAVMEDPGDQGRRGADAGGGRALAASITPSHSPSWTR